MLLPNVRFVIVILLFVFLFFSVSAPGIFPFCLIGCFVTSVMLDSHAMFVHIIKPWKSFVLADRYTVCVAYTY